MEIVRKFLPLFLIETWISQLVLLTNAIQFNTYVQSILFFLKLFVFNPYLFVLGYSVTDFSRFNFVEDRVTFHKILY